MTVRARVPMLGDPLPAALAARPIEPHRKLPTPLVNQHTDADGTEFVDFVGISAERAAEVAEQGRCGLCGVELDYWIAFLGGPASAEHRSYGDPPMHEGCAVAALTLCPHLRLCRHRRAPDHRLHPNTAAPAGWREEKPDRWVLGISRDFTARYVRGSLIFFPQAFKRLRIFDYSGPDNQLVEVT